MMKKVAQSVLIQSFIRGGTKDLMLLLFKIEGPHFHLFLYVVVEVFTDFHGRRRDFACGPYVGRGIFFIYFSVGAINLDDPIRRFLWCVSCCRVARNVKLSSLVPKPKPPKPSPNPVKPSQICSKPLNMAGQLLHLAGLPLNMSGYP